MEVSELLTIVREDYLDDTFAGWQDASDEEKEDQFLWSDNTLLRYINEAQRQACNRTDFLYDDTTASVTAITLVAGQNNYTLNKLINVLEEVEYDGKEITQVDRTDRSNEISDWRTATGMTGKTCRYWVRGRKIFFYPTPDATDAGNIVNLSVYRQPLYPIESSSDEFEIPEENHRDLLWWVLYEAYAKHDADGYDKQKGQDYLANFNRAFGPYIDSRIRVHQLENPSTSWIGSTSYIKNSKNKSDPWHD